MVDECVRFLFTSCEESLNDARTSEVSDPSRVNNKNRTNELTMK